MLPKVVEPSGKWVFGKSLVTSFNGLIRTKTRFLSNDWEVGK